MTRIMIIEDDDDIADALASILEFSDYEVLCCEHGGIAMDLMKSAERAPDLILLDLGLPVMNGFEFREWHLNSEFAHIPVVAMSASHWSQAFKASLKLAGYLSKPMALSDLEDCIAACLPGNRFNAPTVYERSGLKKGGTHPGLAQSPLTAIMGKKSNGE